jgi:L-histidine N-alpha-methyltransferase
MSDESSETTGHKRELDALRDGLSRPLREIAAKYFYDDRGSALFERITELREYYPTRTEISILERDAREIMADARAGHVVELGSGAGRKIRLLLDRWEGRDEGGRCTMLDVNQSFLDQSIEALARAYPRCAFDGVVGDFTTDLDRIAPSAAPRLTVFFAGTIGNLYPHERLDFFRSIAASMRPEDSLLVGVDLVKDTARLESAYNDSEGVTAEFNLNALRVLNARFDADFDESAFEHRAFFDRAKSWIEMRLRATRATRAFVRATGQRVELSAGEEIRTEISCKFTADSLRHDLAVAGLSLRAWRTDPRHDFALAHVWSAP